LSSCTPLVGEVTLHWISRRNARGLGAPVVRLVEAWAGPAYTARALATAAASPKTRARLIAGPQGDVVRTRCLLLVPASGEGRV
jgi:hypothetical protein